MDSGDVDAPIGRSQSEESMESAGESEAADSIELESQEVVPKLASLISRMAILRPELLRVTPVHRALEQRALAFRVRGDYYFKSMQSEKISTFWSHSWHGGHWKKIFTLATFYNGLPSLAFGMAASLVMMLVFGFGDLPGLWRTTSAFRGYSCWSLASGFVGACLVMLFWRPQARVFFDRICINEKDPKAKAEACFSLAGLLRSSDSLLVLWDPTWAQRMWCIFELAAFLESKKGQEKTLIIKPVLLGPVSIAIFVMSSAAMLPLSLVLPPYDTGPAALAASFGTIVACGLLFACFAVRTLRNYFRDLDVMKQQSKSISLDKVRASCCDMNHVDNGQEIPCDRRVLKECVNLWFGSQANFEETVRSEILIVSRDLEECVFTNRWMLAVTVPVLWAAMDLSAGEMGRRPYPSFWEHGAVSWLMFGLGSWLALPSVLQLCILICRLTRARSKCEIFKDLIVALLGLCLPVFIAGACLFFAFFLPVDLSSCGRSAVYVGCLVLYSLCNWCLSVCIRRRLESE